MNGSVFPLMPENPRPSARRLTFLNGLGNISARGIDIFSFLVALRIVGIDAFGIFSLIIIIGNACDFLFSFGLDAACIQDKDHPDNYLNTAWTLQVARSAFVCVLILILAPLFSHLFNNFALAFCLPIFALNVLIGGLSNIGIVVFYRDLDLGRKFSYLLWAKAIEAVARVAFCFFIGGYLGLLWSVVVGSLARLVFSYLISRWRPRFEFNPEIAGRLIAFGKWVAISGIMYYFLGQVDSLYVGKFLGASALGLYRCGFKVSNLLEEVSFLVLYDVFFPLFSFYARSEPEKIMGKYKKVLFFFAVLSLIFSLLLFFMMKDIILIALGVKWAGVVPLAKIFSFTFPAFVTGSISCALLRALGCAQKGVYLQLVSFVILVALIYPFSSLWGLNGVAYAAVLSMLLVMLPTYRIAIGSILSIKTGR